jgi:signal peptidase II
MLAGTRTKLLSALAVSAAIFAADRTTKELARAFLAKGGGDDAIRVIEGVFYLRWSTNSAGFFGFLDVLPAGLRPVVFLAGTAAMVAFLVYLLRRAPLEPPGERHALSLVLAGALGNGFDRAVYGHVIDCVFVRVGEDFARSSWNLADLAIAAGLVWMVVIHRPRLRGREAAAAPKPE